MRNYNIEVRMFNGTDYDILYPVTTMENVIDLQTTLDTKATAKQFVINLTASGWSGNGTTTPYTQQVSVSGVLSTDNLIVSVVPSDTYTTAVDQVNQFQYISYTTALNNAIKVTCVSRKPTIPLTLRVLCVEI